MTSYPVLTMRYRNNTPFQMGEGLFVQYIIKLQPQTRGQMVFTVTPPSQLKLCSLQLTFVGANMPCTRVPGPIASQQDTVVNSITAATSKPACGQSQALTFSVRISP